jgi:hypothetical protein
MSQSVLDVWRSFLNGGKREQTRHSDKLGIWVKQGSRCCKWFKIGRCLIWGTWKFLGKMRVFEEKCEFVRKNASFCGKIRAFGRKCEFLGKTYFMKNASFFVKFEKLLDFMESCGILRKNGQFKDKCEFLVTIIFFLKNSLFF